jgi:hypothetical protein
MDVSLSNWPQARPAAWHALFAQIARQYIGGFHILEGKKA